MQSDGDGLVVSGHRDASSRPDGLRPALKERENPLETVSMASEERVEGSNQRTNGAPVMPCVIITSFRFNQTSGNVSGTDAL